jgi:S-formylglutathione hydrolase FrmB
MESLATFAVKPKRAKGHSAEAHNPELQPSIDYWLKLKGLLDQAEALEAKAKEVSADLCKWGRYYLRQRAQETGEKATSITLNGAVLFVYQSRYQETSSEESIAQYKRLLGDQYQAYFTERRFYKLEIPVESCPPALKAELDAAGIKPTVSCKPTDALHVRRQFDDALDAMLSDLQPVQYIQRPVEKKEV